MYVLDKLWRGEISPSEKYIRKNSEYKKILSQICVLEEALLNELSDKGKENFKEYSRLTTDLQLVENKENFIEAFRIGAQMVLDVVSEARGEFFYPSDE